MYRYNLLIHLLVILTSLLWTFLFLLDYSKSQLLNKSIKTEIEFSTNYTYSNYTSKITLLRNVNLENFEFYDLKYFVWIPHFDFNNAFEAYKNNTDSITQVHYAGMSINAEGNFVYANNFDYSINLLNDLNKNFGINIHSSSTIGLQKFLYKGSNNLLDLIKDFKSKYKFFASLNLNFENLNPGDKELFLNFIKDIYIELKKIDVKLFFSIFAPTINKNNNKNLTLDVLANDIFKIIDFVDYLVIMFYDFSLNGNSKYGLSPLFWLNEYLITLKNINKSKIIIGLPWYGYEYDQTGSIIRSLLYDQIYQSVNLNQIINDEDLQESYIIRPNGNKIYFLSLDDLNKRIEISKKLGFNKFFFWRLSNNKYIDDFLNKDR